MYWTAIIIALIGFAGACFPVLAATRKLTGKVDKLVVHDREQYLSPCCCEAWIGKTTGRSLTHGITILQRQAALDQKVAQALGG